MPPNNPIANLLPQKNVLLLDGALATELERRGYDIDHPLWSTKVLIENPKAIQEVHYDYLTAGADILITSSYQASYQGLEKLGLTEQEAHKLLDRSVTIAEQARDKFVQTHHPRTQPLIAASVGPYGAILHDGSEFHGRYEISTSALFEFHQPRFARLASTTADLLACETIPSMEEAQVLLQCLHEHPQRGAWFSFVCRDELHTCHGEAIATCAQQLDQEPQVLAIGINCTPPQYVDSLITEIKNHTTKPIIVYPNSGEIWDKHKKSWYGNSNPQTFAENAKHWQLLGAQVVGGCCRTTPENIDEIRKILG